MFACLPGMFVVTYIHSGSITPLPAHAVTRARTRAAAHQPTPAVPRVHAPTVGTRSHMLASTIVHNIYALPAAAPESDLRMRCKAIMQAH
eukprot:3038891-Pleurochrysis_carterae.AAC.1